MDKSKGAVARAKITYFFKETFRAHSRAEYREIFSRGLNEDNSGVTGAFPWLYVRAFFAFLILFTVNVLILRLTNNTLYVPSVNFLGGVAFTVPFIILLYELYPKRDMSLFLLLSVLVGGGTVAGGLSQLCYSFINADSPWLNAVAAGFVEEICKAVPAIAIICITGKKNPYACFLLAASVGAGFSVIEDMGYIFHYSFMFSFHSDLPSTVVIFLDRGLTSLCTHVLWTGAVGWAYSISKRPFRSVGLIIFSLSAALHVVWDLPLTGVWKGLTIALCIAVAATVNITIVHKSRINTLASEVDLKHVNEVIINEAKTMGEQLRFRNAANLTYALTLTVLSVIVLLLCALPIGTEYQSVEYSSKEEFINYVEGGYSLIAVADRKYDENGYNIEERFIDGERTYAVQAVEYDGYDGVYYYGYYLSDGTLDSISVELEEIPFRIYCAEYEFGTESVYAFAVNEVKDYAYNADGTVTAVTDAEEFGGYNLLLGLCASGCAVAASCTVILIAFTIKLRRVKNEGQ